MRRHLTLISAALFSTASAVAAGPFDGTWKGDIAASEMSKKPTVFLLAGGKFVCSTCVPKVDVVADGKFHPLSGSPYYDQVSVTVVDARTVKRASRKGTKLASESTSTVSADNKTLAYKYTDMTAPNGAAMTGTGSYTRVAAAPKGAHAMSGSWQINNSGEASDNQLVFTMAIDKDVLTYTSPIGVSYKATLGGPQAPVKGDPGWTSVETRRDGPNKLIETDYRDGKKIAVFVMTISADGKTMTTLGDDLLTGKKSTYVARKQ